MIISSVVVTACIRTNDHAGGLACHRYCCIVKVNKFELYRLSEPVDVVFVGSSQLIAEMFLFICTIGLVVCKQSFRVKTWDQRLNNNF
jgi:hypothetical protein